MTKEMAKEMAAKEMRSPGSPDVVIVHEVAAADREAAARAAAVGLEDEMEEAAAAALSLAPQAPDLASRQTPRRVTLSVTRRRRVS